MKTIFLFLFLIYFVQFLDQMSKGTTIALAIGSFLLVALSCYKIYQSTKTRGKLSEENQKKERKKQKLRKRKEQSDQHVQSEQILSTSIATQEHEDHTLYYNQITQTNPYRILLKKLVLNPDIDQISYNIILNLNKSKVYEGIVKIKLVSNKSTLNNKNIYIDAISSTIYYLSVNKKKIPEQELIYRNHQILIKKQWLLKTQNTIEIIFSNRYAFMGDGLTCYFPLDEYNKYSLKGQVIYARNGFYRAARIFPCLNILNSCQVTLEVLHPNGFNTEGNNHKIEMKIATKKDYPQYQFLFYANNKPFSSSQRLNNSAITESNSYRSNDEIVKAKSQFSRIKLASIHDFFIFSSAISQVRPTVYLSSSQQGTQAPVLKDILIRYFTKDHLVKKASTFLNILESQIIEIFTQIEHYKKSHKTSLKYQCKIDIFFIDDLKAEGDFHNGSIILNQKTIQRGIIDRRLQYLLCRAFIGMGLLQKKSDGLLTLEGVLKLNNLTLQIFPDCCDFIFIKNKEYQSIRNYSVNLLKKQDHRKQNNKILMTEEEEKQNEMLCWVMEYYEKECRYFVKDLQSFECRISPNLKNIVDNLYRLEDEQFWTFFIARYPLIEFNISEVLIKIALKEKGPPKREAEMQYAKSNFVKSKYYIKFFTFQEIQSDLKRFLELQTHGVEKVLPYIKIKESFLPLIPQKLQGYLYVKENRLDGKKLYEQFKKYNQANNFHHISALRREMKRIKHLARDNIEIVRRDIHCGLMGWKLLHKLNIYPDDDETFNIVNKLEEIKEKKKEVRIERSNSILSNNLNALEEAKKLQKLLQEGDKEEK